MSKAKNNEKEFCAHCGLDLFRPGVEPVERDGKVYCADCAAKLDAQKNAQTEIQNFSAFMSGKRLLIPLDGEYMQWSRNIEVDQESGQLWLVHSRCIGGRGPSFAGTGIDVFAEEPKQLTANEALRLAEEQHPGIGEAFGGLTDTNGADYLGRYKDWVRGQRRFNQCGPMAAQLKADFQNLGIPMAETLAYYGAPLYFYYDEKTGKYIVSEPAERSSGTVTLFRDTNRNKFRWFLLEYVVRAWADGEERKNTEQLRADWRWAVPYDPRVPEKELALQKLSRIYPADSDELQGYASRILQALNRGQTRIVQWMLDPDTMTLYMPAEKHHHIRDLQAEQSRLEAQLQKDPKVPGASVIAERLNELKLEGLFIDVGPDMAMQLTGDMKKLGFTEEQVKKALPDRLGHGSAGYWAEGVEEDRGRTFTYSVCREASAADFRFIIVERIVRLNVCWPQLHSYVRFFLWIKHLMKIFSHYEIQNKTYTTVLEPQLQAYIEEKIRLLGKNFPAYNWTFDLRASRLTGTPKAGTDVPELPRPGVHVSAFNAPALFLCGDPSGHGEQFSAGPIRSGKYAGRYYWSVVDDGYPNRMGGGGLIQLLPDGLVQDGCVLQRELYRWIREIWDHTSMLRVDEQDAVVLNLDLCRKEYPKPYRVSEDGILWQVDNGHAVILGYQGESTDLVIPEKLGAYYVLAIHAEAFCGHPLRSVEIPHMVERIGSHALGYESGAPGYRQYTPKLTIRGYSWSGAGRYAKQHGLPFEDLRPVQNGKVRQGQKIVVGETVTATVHLSEEEKHWHGVAGGTTTQTKGSGHFDDFQPEPLSCARCGKTFSKGETCVTVDGAVYCPDCAARVQKPPEKFRMGIREILITVFFGAIAVAAFFAKGWLLGMVFAVIAVFMPFGLYHDFKKEQARKNFRDAMNKKKKK